MSPREPGAAPDEKMREKSLAALRKYWGYEAFREGQWTAVSAALSGQDALVILPTGGGKSLCYQVPALVLDGLTLVISPLVALMEDQVARLRARGVEATFINSTISHAESERRWNHALFGKLKLLYVAPERLQTEIFQARAQRLNVSLLAVDEAHCISEWGHSFRPSYLEIAGAHALLGAPPTMAVTATATPHVRRDIEQYLALRSPVTVVTGFDRPNLVWSIFRAENKQKKVEEILEAVPGTGIVYAATRKGVEEWADWLRRSGVTAACYHGGLSAEVRSAALEAWLSGEAAVMAATNAFGMGIDKPDVRFVVHVDLPASVESYYQEAGRGGRDGKRAHAVLLYRAGDEDTPAALLERSHPRRELVRRVYDTMCSMHGVAIGELPDRPLIVRLQPTATASRCTRSELLSVLEMLARQGLLALQNADPRTLYLRFPVAPPQMRASFDRGPRTSVRTFVEKLMRAVPADSFAGWTRLDQPTLARKLDLAPERLLKGLAFLAERGLVDWFAAGDGALVTLLEARSAQPPYDGAAASRARKRSETRLSEMLRYARSISCRRQFLLAYFGERGPERCGRCDICLGRHEPIVVTPADEPLIRKILDGVAEKEPRASWVEGHAALANRLDSLIDWLLQEGYLRVESLLEENYVLTEQAHRLREQWAPAPDAAPAKRAAEGPP